MRIVWVHVPALVSDRPEMFNMVDNMARVDCCIYCALFCISEMVSIDANVHVFSLSPMQ